MGLPLVDRFDSRERCFADELFERLYSGEDLTELKAAVDPQDAEWSRGMHAACANAAGDFANLASLCRHDARKAAHATKQLLDALPQKDGGVSSQPSGTMRDAADGLSGVQFGANPWSGKWEGEEQENERAKTLAERLKDDERLKQIALLAGKFKRIVVSKQKVKVFHGADEISDVVQGDDLTRLLPSEIVRFASPRHRLAAIRDLMERKCLQYQMTSTEVLGRGPLILCLDKSTSMLGDKDTWASAVALALLDMVHRQHRTFIMLCFHDEIFYRKAVEPGRPFPESALLVPCGGNGTDIGKVLDLSLNAVESRSIMNKADIVIVTDGGSSTATAAWIRERAKARNVNILGIGIDVTKESLAPWCNEVHCVTDMSGIDDGTSTALFGK